MSPKLPLQIWAHLPKGPFRTKNDIAMEIVVFCYRGSILQSVPIRCHFSQGKQHPNYQRGSELLGGRFVFFFSGRGGERGVRGARKGAGVGFLLKIPGGGGVLPGEGGGWRGAWRVPVGNLGGGAKYFISALKFPPRLLSR